MSAAGRCTSPSNSSDRIRFAFPALLAMAVIALPPLQVDAAKRSSDAPKCSIKGSAAGLDIQCPRATVAEFLTALGKATGLQSDYGADVGAHSVSVALRRVSLHQALEKGLDKFNYAVWPDEQRPSVSHVSIVGLRQSDGVDRLDLERQTAAAAMSEPSTPQPRLPTRAERTRARATEDEDGTKQTTAVTPVGPGAPWVPASPNAILASAPKAPGGPPAAQQTARSAPAATPLDVGKPTSVLLMPPTAGATPLLPERVDSTAILRPQ